MPFLGTALTRALHEYHVFDHFAVSTFDRAIACGASQCFQFQLSHNVRRFAVAEFRQVIGIVRGETSGLHNRAKLSVRACAYGGGNIHLKTTRCTGGFRDAGIQVNGDFVIRFHRCDQGCNAGILRVLERGMFWLALLELPHDTTQTVGLFDNAGVVTGFGGFECRRHAGNAAADHHNVVVFALFTTGIGLLHRFDFGATHADVVGCHFLRGFVVFAAFGTNPDDTFTQVDASGWHCPEVETFGFGTARTRHNDRFGYFVVAFRRHVGFDHVHACLTAQEVVGFAEANPTFAHGY